MPHFEKMLYDNALLVPPYLHAWLLTGEERYREVAERTLDYMVRELRLPSGGFASAQDADTDGVEGLTYTWTEEDGVPAELLQPFEHGRSIIRGELDDETRARLLEIRERRPQPFRDDKVIASWNGLALAALAEGARFLASNSLLQAAVELGELLCADPLWRTMRDGRAKFPAYLDDYANVAHGLYELHVATGDLRWLRESRRLALQAVELFGDPERGGFFLSPADGEQLVARQKSLEDNPIPSGNSMLAFVLLRLARIWGDEELEREAVGALRLVRDYLDARAVGVRLGAVRARSSSLAAARARDPRRAGHGAGPRRARRLRPEHRDRVRACGRRPAARGEDRLPGGLRVRAVRLPGARHGSGRAVGLETTRGSRSSPSKTTEANGLMTAIEHVAERLPVVGGLAVPLLEDQLLHRERPRRSGLDGHPRVDERVLRPR